MAELAYIGLGGRERRTRPLLRTMIGDVLRRTRLDQGRTLADVARAARVSMPYLSEVERGRKEASSEVLAAVCDALRIDLAEVVHEVGRDLANDRPAAARAQRLGPAQKVVAAPRAEASRQAESEAIFRPAPRRRAHPVPPPQRRTGDVVLLAA
jgi:transcriptional regulator with XRE-family HTH domain